MSATDEATVSRPRALPITVSARPEAPWPAPEQERMEGWIMEEVGRGEKLPGLYPMNEATKARYEAWTKG